MKHIGLVIWEYNIVYHKRAAIIGLKYIDAIESCGAMVSIITYGSLSRERYLDTCDSFIFAWGNDIDPTLYHQDIHGARDIFAGVDAWIYDFMKEIIKIQKPIFGICKGMQMINVVFAGTLCQHLEDSDFHLDALHRSHTVDTVSIVYSWFLSEIFDKKIAINSIHHQWVDILWDGLRVIARSDHDNIVEAIEHTSLPIYWVQWHPEELIEQRKIFEWFMQK